MGSEFAVRLPATAAHVTESGLPQASALGKKTQGLQVLVVDDSLDTAKAMARLLALSGHAVRIATSGSDAIAAASDQCPDAVLLDIGLPGMNGYDVAKKLRHELCPDALIIAVSGYGDPEVQRRTKEAGFDHHLVKPIDFHTLMTLVSRPES